MKTRRILWAMPVIAALAAGGLFLAQRGESAPERANGDPVNPADLKPAVSLPISQVILFNSGVGHFTRSGDIEGDARVDLSFPEQDINDLIKSMTLRDLSPNGRVAAVTLTVLGRPISASCCTTGSSGSSTGGAGTGSSPRNRSGSAVSLSRRDSSAAISVGAGR